jgi:hypothetical protein
MTTMYLLYMRMRAADPMKSIAKNTHWTMVSE